MIITAARIHDIGKIGISDVVLNKPGKLTDEERQSWSSILFWERIQAAALPDFVRGVKIVRHHRANRRPRYPDGLVSNGSGSVVIAAADTRDALTSDRPYRQGMPAERACAVMCEGRGTHGHLSLSMR